MRQWLLALRRDAGLTQKQLADMAGIAQSIYSRVEQGKCWGDNLPLLFAVTMSRIFETDVNEIARLEAEYQAARKRSA